MQLVCVALPDAACIPCMCIHRRTRTPYTPPVNAIHIARLLRQGRLGRLSHDRPRPATNCHYLSLPGDQAPSNRERPLGQSLARRRPAQRARLYSPESPRTLRRQLDRQRSTLPPGGWCKDAGNGISAKAPAVSQGLLPCQSDQHRATPEAKKGRHTTWPVPRW